MVKEVKKVMVVGAGFMGTGIAQTTIQSGYPTLLWGLDQEEVAASLKKIDWALSRMDQKGKLSESKKSVINRIQTTTNLSDAGNSDLIIETVTEKLAVKEDVFQSLDKYAPKESILASNTSTIPISKLAAVTKQPERVVGIHFSSPVPLMPVAEVIRTIVTSDKIFETAVSFVRSLNKEPIQVNFDQAGFIFNRINLPSNVEAIRLVERGVASVENIDNAMKLGFGRPMGPFETSDMVGLDTGYYALLSLYEETKDPKFYPPDLLSRKVWLGHLGKKVGKGWYVYGPDGERLGVSDT
jgi:3-hydroxybutyryl-CoA dehydrogenase